MSRVNQRSLLVVAVAVALLTNAALAAQQPPGPAPVPLEIKGGNTTVVPVETWVKRVQEVLVVNTFPFFVNVTTPDPNALYFWTYSPLVTAVDMGSSLKITAGPKGETLVSVKIIAPKLDKDGKFLGWNTSFGSSTFYIDEVTPGPGPGPNPPDPKPPDPKPPDPKPPVGDLRVVFVRESAASLTRGQDIVWNSTKLVTFLNGRCVKSTSTNRPEWRKWDKDQQVTKETPTMTKLWEDTKEALAKPPPTQLPIIVIVIGTSGKMHPLPDTEQGVIDLINKETGKTTSSLRVPLPWYATSVPVLMAKGGA